MAKAGEGSKSQEQQVCFCSEMNLVEDILSFSVVDGSFSINLNPLSIPAIQFPGIPNDLKAKTYLQQ